MLVNRTMFDKPITVGNGDILKVQYTYGVPMSDPTVAAYMEDKPGADSERVAYDTGAQRSAAVEEYRYDLWHPIFMKEVSKVWAYGGGRYGDHNWEQGFPMPVLFNHLLGHIWDYLSGDRSEPHLEHAACNIVMLVTEHHMRYDQHRKYLRDPGCILSPEQLEEIKRFNARKKYQGIVAEGMGKLMSSGALVKHDHYAQNVETIRSRHFPEIPLLIFIELLKSSGFKIIIGDNNLECIDGIIFNDPPREKPSKEQPIENKVFVNVTHQKVDPILRQFVEGILIPDEYTDASVSGLLHLSFPTTAKANLRGMLEDAGLDLDEDGDWIYGMRLNTRTPNVNRPHAPETDEERSYREAQLGVADATLKELLRNRKLRHGGTTTVRELFLGPFAEGIEPSTIKEMLELNGFQFAGDRVLGLHIV